MRWPAAARRPIRSAQHSLVLNRKTITVYGWDLAASPEVLSEHINILGTYISTLCSIAQANGVSY